MKLQLMFAFRFGFSWEPRTRTFLFFPLPGVGVRLELGGAQLDAPKALPAPLPVALPDDDVLFAIIVDNPTAHWAQLKPAIFQSGLTLPRAIAARTRLIDGGRVAVQSISVQEYGATQTRRVLATLT